jgi:hypothetical protein
MQATLRKENPGQYLNFLSGCLHGKNVGKKTFQHEFNDDVTIYISTMDATSFP